MRTQGSPHISAHFYCLHFPALRALMSTLRYIHTPLATWVDMPNRPAPIPEALVILLDALDEADHDGKGWA